MRRKKEGKRRERKSKGAEVGRGRGLLEEPYAAFWNI